MSGQLHEFDDGGAGCPGLFDEAGKVRSVCRACGKCEDLILAFDALTDDNRQHFVKAQSRPLPFGRRASWEERG